MSNPDASRPSGWETEALNRKSVEKESDAGASHPCVSCGACCAYFLLPYFGECQAHGIPEDLVEQFTLSGRHEGDDLTKNIRCIALNGTLVSLVRPVRSDNRSSTCRICPLI